MENKVLFDTVEELYPEYLKIFEDVCNIESPTDYKEGVDKVGAYFADLGKKHGWKVDIYPQSIAGDVVAITMNDQIDAQPICLSGHIDTVHPLGLFSYPPVRTDEEKIYGPGTTDCKGGVVAGFMAMDALDRCGFRGRPVMLLIQTDEEKGSSISNRSTINYICDRAKNAVAFLNLEGAKKGQAILWRKGISRYEITVTGKAGHSSKCYENTASAIAEAAHKILKLETFKEAEGITCNCGVISGGTVANSVAEKCVFQADIRFVTKEEMERADRFVKEVSENSTIEGCSCEVKLISSRPAMERSNKNFALLDRINEINRAVGLEERMPKGGAGGSDAAYATAAEIPCVDNLGVEGGGIHSEREYAWKRSLPECAIQLAVIAKYI